MDVHKDGEAYRVTGRVTTRLQLECGRCLEPFEIAVDSPFELRYVPRTGGRRPKARSAKSPKTI